MPTVSGGLLRVLLAANGIEGPEWFRAGDALIYPGNVVSRDADVGEVKIAPTDEPAPVGVAGCPTYQDLETAYSLGWRVPVWLCGSGVHVMVLHDDDTGATTLYRGQKFIVDDANAGCVMLWAYTDAAVATDTMSGLVGVMLNDVTISGDTPTFIPLGLSL